MRARTLINACWMGLLLWAVIIGGIYLLLSGCASRPHEWTSRDLSALADAVDKELAQ